MMSDVRKKILVIEKTPGIYLLLKKKFGDSHHFDCEIDLTGEKCLKLDYQERPDVILIDLDMPKISGFGLLREIKWKKEIADIPIVVMSAYSQKEIVEETFNLGAKAYFFSKERTVEELLQMLTDYL